MSLGPEAVGNIYEYLKGAQSANAEIQRTSEEALKQFENVPGFCSCLAEILKNKEAEHSARWLAGIHFKNIITKSWKARIGSGGIVEEEKDHLRRVLFELIEQENAQLALPVAVAFAKVARADYPRQWPGLFEQLLQRMQGSNTLLVRRAFLVLHHILKELSSMRLPKDKQSFAEVSQKLYQLYWEQWLQDTQQLVGGLGPALQSPQHPSPLAIVFERWFLELKGLRRMILFSTQSDARSLSEAFGVAQIAPACLQALQAFHGMRPANLKMSAQLHVMVDRALMKLAKTLHDIQETHPWTFYSSGCLRGSVEYFAVLLTKPPHAGPPYERFVMQAMICLNDVLQSKAYRGVPEALSVGNIAAEEQVAKIKQWSREVQQLLTSFWQAGHAELLCRALIRHYFPLTNKELQEWAENAEEFQQQTGSGVWQDSLRTCAETLFASLLSKNKDIIARAVLDILDSTSRACPSGAPCQSPMREGYSEAVLAKEAAYNAVRIGVWELMDHVPFKEWLHNALLPELQDSSHGNRPLRRQTAILIGDWVPKLAAQDRPAVYRALLGLMADDDFAVSLAGFAALHDLVNDWDFTEEPFLEFVQPCFQLVAQQLRAADDYETQIQIFNLLNIVLDRLADSVKPYVQTLLQVFPDMWEESQGQSLLRIQVLMAIQRVVNALGLDSREMYPLLLPILKFCTEAGQEDQLNLLEDGLQLWLIALRNAPAAEPGLLQIFPSLVPIMEASTEHVQVVAAIAISCTLLGGRDHFLLPYGRHLVAVLQTLIGHLSEKGTLLLMPVLDVVLQSIPQEGPSLLEPALRLLWQDIRSGQGSSIVIAAAIGIFARILLQTAGAFAAFFPPSPSNGAGNDFEAFVELWLEKFDNLASTGARKLSALALCVLLHIPSRLVLQNLTSILANITAVWFETEGENGDGEEQVYISIQPVEGSGDPGGAVVNSQEAEGEFRRAIQLREQDPVNSLKISTYLKKAMMQAATSQGAENFNAALSALDPSLGHQLKAVLQSP